MTILIPHGFDPEKLKNLVSDEGRRAKELKDQGKWLHVWRVVGKWANLSVFDVESPLELHQILSTLPLYPLMDIKVTALCEIHPS